jgi:hypothetical protein
VNAKRIFEEMKQIGDSACDAEDYQIAIGAAELLNFRDFSTESSQRILADLKYEDPSGDEVWLVVKWHDPSGPFQNLPDINRIRLSLIVPSHPSIDYMREYKD